MIKIKLRYDEDPKRAISKLKQILSKEGLFNDLKKRRYYVKPSLKKKLKREEAGKQRAKDIRKELKNIERLEQQQWS